MTEEDRYRYIARQVGRARLPEPEHTDERRISELNRITYHAELVYRFFRAQGFSRAEMTDLFDNYFCGIEKRFGMYYSERIAGADTVYSGISVKEMDGIAEGRREEARTRKERRWMNVSTNKEIARRHAQNNVDAYGTGILLGIKTDSVRDRLVSPGYTAGTIFAQPKDDIGEPDSLMRGMFNEEHHLPLDADLRDAKMHITIMRTKKKIDVQIEEKYREANITWEAYDKLHARPRAADSAAKMLDGFRWPESIAEELHDTVYDMGRREAMHAVQYSIGNGAGRHHEAYHPGAFLVGDIDLFYSRTLK